VQRRYLGLVRDHGYRLPPGYEDFADDVETIRRALALRAEPTVACNNDLLAANLIDDGTDVRLIDYEYSGNNDPCFELGNIWSECHLSLDQLEQLVTCYYGRPRRSRLARARVQGLMSQYGWTLWGVIQEAASPIDFDYWSWGMEKYERAVATFRGSDLDRLLQQAQELD
jgi:thiamine kinase-like enzyme